MYDECESRIILFLLEIEMDQTEAVSAENPIGGH
jgi:hypothetical protein